MKNKKMTSRCGFTLVEMLMVVAILAFTTAAGAAGLASVMATRISMIQTADAEVLGSTALQVVANELRFGQNIKISETGNYVELNSANYGSAVTVQVEDNGQLTIGGYEALGEMTYSGLTLKDLHFELEDDTISIKITVAGSRGDLWTGGFNIQPLNTLNTAPATP